jgi:uncharacterized membrane protein YfcA
MKKVSASILAGGLAGAVNGFFGAGGGMILVPMFLRLLKMEEKRAFATSLAVILPISAVSAGVFISKGELDIVRAVPFILGGTAGGLLGGKIFKKVSGKTLRILLLLFIIYGGVRLIFAK